VAILDLERADPAGAAARLGGRHLGLVADVTDKAACEAAAAAVLRAFGRIDALVNNAGITQAVGTLEIGGADYDRVLDVSLRGTLYMSQAVLPAMRTRRSGAIVCISSVSAQRGGGIFGGPHYSAAKAGVLGLARAMAREFSATIPLARLGRADDVAGACLFLASDLAAYCTGVTLDVNGGMLIH
jgi:NAD(P)-dependent dehydrogenase (short-subunit alcohol dehydrogenase family)